MLKAIGEGLPPRVWAAYFRLICNGWMTARRFQGNRTCLFGCGGGHDSIEHFAHCPVVSHWLLENLGINPAPIGDELDHFLGMRIDDERDNTYMNTRIRWRLGHLCIVQGTQWGQASKLRDCQLGGGFRLLSPGRPRP